MEKNIIQNVYQNYQKKKFFELVENISNGIPIGTPVFDGALQTI